MARPEDIGEMDDNVHSPAWSVVGIAGQPTSSRVRETLSFARVVRVIGRQRPVPTRPGGPHHSRELRDQDHPNDQGGGQAKEERDRHFPNCAASGARGRGWPPPSSIRAVDNPWPPTWLTFLRAVNQKLESNAQIVPLLRKDGEIPSIPDVLAARRARCNRRIPGRYNRNNIWGYLTQSILRIFPSLRGNHYKRLESRMSG